MLRFGPMVLVLLGSPMATAGDEPGLATLERLVGQWEEVSFEGEPTGKIVSSFRATAGGTAILETVFPGTRHEVATLYREEQGGVVATHYCVSGNQPRFRAKRTGPHQIVLEMTGISNLDSPGEPHMRPGTFTWIHVDEIETEWLEYRNDEVTHIAAYRLRRRK